MANKKPDDNSIAQRVNWLIDTRGKSLYAVALESGIPQRTLARIAHRGGKRIENPRADAVRMLADYFHVTERWLITGKGEMSAAMQAYKEDQQRFREESRRGWHDLVKALELPKSVEQAVHRLPQSSSAAMNLLGEALGISAEDRAFLGEHCYLQEVPAWTFWLATLVQRVGRDAVRTQLIKHEAEARAKFRDVPSTMLVPPRLPSEVPPEANRVAFPPDAKKRKRGSR